MRCLNESIAREANQEDNCKGHFWEGRFKSQALLDEAALLTCMMYVDLNPIRAGICDTPEQSDFTSIQERLRTYANASQRAKTQPDETPASKRKNRNTTQRQQQNKHFAPAALLPFGGNEHHDNTCAAIPFSAQDYFVLLEWTGRAIRDDKKGAIPSHLAPILQRLNINEMQWLTNINYFGHRFYKVIGTVDAIRHYSHALKQSWCRGLSQCSTLYRNKPHPA